MSSASAACFFADTTVEENEIGNEVPTRYTKNTGRLGDVKADARKGGKWRKNCENWRTKFTSSDLSARKYS